MGEFCGREEAGSSFGVYRDEFPDFDLHVEETVVVEVHFNNISPCKLQFQQHMIPLPRVQNRSSIPVFLEDLLRVRREGVLPLGSLKIVITGPVEFQIIINEAEIVILPGIGFPTDSPS